MKAGKLRALNNVCVDKQAKTLFSPRHTEMPTNGGNC
jgi:hypothetical protein